jgi:unsaturated rhamnogalacturonyl hydrolase
MGFDPAFYYYRPQNVRAAHGFGPCWPARRDRVTKSDHAVINDGAVQFDHQPANMEAAR